MILQNKFEMLSSRVIQCRVEEKKIRRQKAKKVECFKYGEEGHKCKEYLLWKERQIEEKAACVAMPQKVQQIE